MTLAAALPAETSPGGDDRKPGGDVPRGAAPRRRVRRAVPARGRPGGKFLIVALGASAGGLDACRKLVDGLPAGNGMAFILVQHLDPTHESMLVDLLASHTSMIVQQATNGAQIEPDHLYVIPPGTYLSVGNGTLRLSRPQARHGARLPFDFLLRSLAEDCRERAVCVVLSGTGSDGSVGLSAVRENNGLVIAQDPAEAAYDGMPRSAIATGGVDHVLAVARIPEALAAYARRAEIVPSGKGAPAKELAPDLVPQVIELLRTRTAHDFTLYKPGTLRRRIERRMGMSAVPAADIAGYLDILRSDSGELDLLANDLLINVTSFFRDPKVFEHLAAKVVPDLVRTQPLDRPLRIWIAGCSTGEEAYSLAMLFIEQISAAKRNVKLQVFASDIDPDAVASAREGFYPASVAADLSPARLGRFFRKEDQGYRVTPELRSIMVFTVHDVLADPPFSRLDLVSCRNLLIYLLPEAQGKVISRFHFSLRDGGLLLLGSAEEVGSRDGHFAVVSKPIRLYRHVGRSGPGDVGFSTASGDGVRLMQRPVQDRAPTRQAALAELCRQMVMEAYAPAAVLINHRNECLFSLGPTDRYLRMAPGRPTHDLLAMARNGLRTKLRAAIQQASQSSASVSAAGGRMSVDGRTVSFSIAIHPVLSDGEQLLLVCFVEGPGHGHGRGLQDTSQSAPQIADLEQELGATRAELQGAIRNLETSNEEQKAYNEEALSIQEEFQSTNEELLTSKEEMQSLNEELTALNSQLQETLERQRATANDLQNTLYSTDVATIFLDADLCIRFFSPATKSLFSVISTDLGRPLADLSSLSSDAALMADARTVLRTLTPIEREVDARNGAWYVRRILPYRTQDNRVEGVVMTFADITERRHAADALQAAKRESEMANVAKSRFLAAASHDLRQPLQTMALLQGLLLRTVDGDRPQKLVRRLDDALGVMSRMLNTLLDISQIDAGTVHPEPVVFPLDDLLARLRDEFAYHAQAGGLTLHVVPCSLSICTDPRLLEQMIRNLLSNALKYTRQGGVLLGCRRRAGRLSIEIWDTGIGIPGDQLQAIFEEYHQLENAARERSRGFGLGLAIVQRLGALLGHPINVRSWPGKGSVFAIDVPLAPRSAVARLAPVPAGEAGGTAEAARRTGSILIVEDDPEVCDLLEILLQGEGHRTTTAPDGVIALERVTQGTVRPDLILTDYNLPNGIDGLQLIATLRDQLHRQIPAIVLTGDISTGALRDIALQVCVRLDKPVKSPELTALVQRLLPPAPAALAAPELGSTAMPPVIFIVDDDSHVRAALRSVLEDNGRSVEDYASCEAFLEAYRPGREGCLLVDAYLPGMKGVELLQRLRDDGQRLPSIMITGSSDVTTAVRAMKAGASDFIEKPIGRVDLIVAVDRALERARDSGKLQSWRESAASRVAGLTPRQRQIMELILDGQPSKNIAVDLGISQRTVENHRASIMKRTGTVGLPALARLALVATWNGLDEPLTQPPPLRAPAGK